MNCFPLSNVQRFIFVKLDDIWLDPLLLYLLLLSAQKQMWLVQFDWIERWRIECNAKKEA